MLDPRMTAVTADYVGKLTEVIRGRVHVADGVVQPNHRRDAGTVRPVSKRPRPDWQ